MNAPRLVVDDISVLRVNTPRPVLNQISLAFASHELVSICGHNGAGKTTLARTLLGLCPVAKGEITLNGHPLHNAPRGQIQMVFQPPSAQLIGQTIFEELAVTALQRNPSLTRTQLEPFVQDCALRVGLRAPIHADVHALSGGELQRLCLAQALASQASVLVLDEALSSLDPATRTSLRRELRDLTVSHGMTILMITHDMEDVLVADRVVVLDLGEVRLDASPRDFFYDEAGQASPCSVLGFHPPYLVEAAITANQKWGAALKPLTEEQYVEELSHVPVP
ncbi:energy-coupling factor ABC transporter ATP-binding protein [Alicyclobacillus fastidiosus]|uniref:ABC transporter ATP-binding protein n=1 Tax=Alicyclobacillus fastidiosus TaxID=392011 RepID=A0ABV5AL94_9BACL|nr:ABC transporter ATP-binding protein [Alicyclobacillus fastidiosus]WEH09382.1 ABC transporter ATP-binding protein [Alicyclobacillus fastidiosus]